MKTIITLLLIGFCHQGVQAQIKSKAQLPGNGQFPVTSSNLDLEQIKGHINAGTFCYQINLSSTAIVPPKNPQRLKGLDGHYNTTKYVKVERNYLRTNGLLLRSDRSYNRNQGENFEVLIYPDGSDTRKIDPNHILVTWRSAERGLKTFNLKNVSIQYKPYGVLIIGDYELDGMVFGVSMGLTPSACLQ